MHWRQVSFCSTYPWCHCFWVLPSDAFTSKSARGSLPVAGLWLPNPCGNSLSPPWKFQRASDPGRWRKTQQPWLELGKLGIVGTNLGVSLGWLNGEPDQSKYIRKSSGINKMYKFQTTKYHKTWSPLKFRHFLIQGS